ncbi:DNA repair protein rad51d [Parelaphostrongylus tenuis]|uniref:DNA repair protein rad51d n=1 Tax=Parelaphostrongylus tenuis TaxID=148309 RepID=A0AAD5RB60_PARTN|nr:DNA repair protein rad51d [Parelaphostrongylus tenuis]
MNETAVDALVALGFPLALHTGIDGIDYVLQNDLQYGDLSEISGDHSVGKTQLCYALVANILLETEFGVLWIDSNGSFRSLRLIEHIHGRKEAIEKDIMILLERLRVIRAVDHIQLIEALDYAEYSQNEEKKDSTKLWKKQMKGRISIEECDGDVRIIQSLDASNMPSRRSRFQITSRGLHAVN